MTLSISNLVNVQVNLAATAAQGQNLNTLLVIGDSAVIPPAERIRYYTSASAVGIDFSLTAPEYQASLLYFAQVPTPATLAIGRWPTAAYSGVLRGGSVVQDLTTYLTTLKSFTAGSLALVIDGSPVTTAAINLSSATTLAGAAAILTTAIAGASVQWDANNKRFIVISDTSGIASTMGYATGAGTLDSVLLLRLADGAVTNQGGVAETITVALNYLIATYGQTFFGVSLAVATPIVDADRLALAAIVAADQSHILGLTTASSAVIDPTSTTDFAYILAASTNAYTFVQYSTSSLYADVSFFGRALTTNYQANASVITLMYKQEPLVVPENLTQTQANTLKAKNVNVLASYYTANLTSIIEFGTVASGDYFDTIAGLVWLKTQVQLDLFNVLYSNPTKVPQTDVGIQLLVTTAEGSCYRGVVNGLLAAGVWSAPGFGNLAQGDFLPRGYYVYAQSVASQSAADRAARKSPPIQIAVKLAGAVHTVAVIINVNR